MDPAIASTSTSVPPLIPSFSAVVPKDNDPNPTSLPIPVLPSWPSFNPPLVPDTSSPAPSTSPSSGSLLSSSPSPETTSRALWTITQSDPVLPPDLYAVNVESIGALQSGQNLALLSPKRRRRKGKEDVASVDIPLCPIGHTANLDDNDPLAVLRGSENVDAFDLDANGQQGRKGRSRLRVSGSTLEDAKEMLHAPQHLACLAPSQGCPHGSNCPFYHVHKQNARISAISTPVFSPEASRGRSVLPILRPTSPLSGGDVSSNMAPEAASTNQTSDWVPVQDAATTSSSTFKSDAQSTSSYLQSPTLPATLSPSDAPFDPSASRALPSDGSPVAGFSQPAQYRVRKAPQLDELGLPIHPLLPLSDLSQYRRSTRNRSGSGSNRSIDSIVNEFFGERNVDDARGGKRSRRGSMGGKYAVAEIPTWKGSRAPTPSNHAVTISNDPPADLLPLSRILPTSDSSSAKSPTQSTVAILEPPSHSGSSLDGSMRPSRKERHEERGRSNFSMAIKALGSNPALSIPSGTTAPNTSFVATNGISLSTVVDATRHRQTLSSSSDRTTRETISPTLSTHSSATGRSMDPISLFSGPSFTDPGRPLFSGIQRPAFDSQPVHDSNRIESWWDKQKGKDYRAAQRLERALEEKRLKIVRQLEWKPPIVEEPGYGYGDGTKKPVDVRLDNGVVMKVLSEQERREMQDELGRIMRELESAREIMNSFAQAFPGGVVPRSLMTSPATSAGTLSPASGSDMSLQSTPSLMSVVQSPTHLERRSSQTTLPLSKMQLPHDAVARELAMGATARERVTNKLNLMRSQMESSSSSGPSMAKDTRRPEVIVRRSANALDMGVKGQGMGLFGGGGKQGGNMLDLLNANMGKVQRPEERIAKRPSNAEMPSIFNMRMPSLADREAAIRAREQAQARSIERPSTSTPQPPKPTSERAIIGRSIGLNLEDLMKSRSDTPRATSSSKAIEADILRQPNASQHSTATPASSRPSNEQPPTTFTASATTSADNSVKQSRRISMSTAKPGEEASTQTMEDLSFDDSSDDDEGNESREYVSASEGYETANDEQQESEWENDAKAKGSEKPVSSTSNAVESPPRPNLQRKRSSTTIGLPAAAETKHRSSPLEGWSFNFSHRLPQDGVSATPLSPHSTATPLGRYHMRKLSQESARSSFLGTGVAAPNNTPSSPPPVRPIQSSPTPDRSALQMSFPNLTMMARSTIEPSAAPTAAHSSWDEPYFVVKRSANTMDELGNVIKYATARVMSGGVKIGSIQAREPNGAIPEEEEGREEVTQEAEDMRNFFVTSYAEPSGSSKSIPLASPTEQAPSKSTYPAGVPVPGQPHVLSTPAEGTHPAIVSPIPQRSASSMTLPHLNPTVSVVAPAQYSDLASAPAAVPTSSLPTSSTVDSSIVHHQRRPHIAQPGVQNTMPPPPTTQPIEYCGDWRTTGHCRFGARCRYSHDIEPRVKTSRNASSSVYRPTVTRPVVPPPATIDKFPALPPGHRLVNILPQPHHIPGVPVAQQPYSPFVYDTASAVAHPLTAPAATAAAEQGLEMADKDKAAKILKSLGLDPRRARPNLPTPVVMADGEIRYNMATPRPRQPTEYSSPAITSSNINPNGHDQAQSYMPRYEAGYGVVTPPVTGAPAAGAASVVATQSISNTPRSSGPDGVPMNGPDDDIWTVSSGRQMRASITSDVTHGRERRSRYSVDKAILYQSPDQSRAFSPTHPPPSYSPVQHVHHGHKPHPVHASVPSSSSAQPSTTLTQEEVMKVLTALGINVPTLPSAASAVPATPVPAYTSPNHGVAYGYPPSHPQYYQMPHDPHHRPY